MAVGIRRQRGKQNGKTHQLGAVHRPGKQEAQTGSTAAAYGDGSSSQARSDDMECLVRRRRLITKYVIPRVPELFRRAKHRRWKGSCRVTRALHTSACFVFPSLIGSAYVVKRPEVKICPAVHESVQELPRDRILDDRDLCRDPNRETTRVPLLFRYTDLNAPQRLLRALRPIPDLSTSRHSFDKLKIADVQTGPRSGQRMILTRLVSGCLVEFAKFFFSNPLPRC